MRGTKVKKLRAEFPYSDEKSTWRRLKRIVTRFKGRQSATYKGPRIPVALPGSGGNLGPDYECNPMVWERPVRAIGAFFGNLSDLGKQDALMIAAIAGRISKTHLDHMVANLKLNGRAYT